VPDYTVGLIVETQVPARIHHNGWRIVPLEFPDVTYGMAVDAMAAHGGFPTGLIPSESLPPIDASVITVLQPADSADEAIELATDNLGRLAAALGFRQMGQGRHLVYVAWSATSHDFATSMPYRHRALITHHQDDDESIRELNAFASILANERSAALVRLYLDALRDPSADSSLARLWTLLETLAEKFEGSKRKKVEDAVRHAGVGGGTDFRRVYQLRNDFVHGGRSGDPQVVGGLRDQIAFTAWTVLLNARFAPVDPHSRRPDPASLPIRNATISRPRATQDPG
jgi:hypothetical protein